MLLKNAGVQVRDKPRTPDTVLTVNPNSCSGLTGKNWDELYGKMEKIFGNGIKVVFSKKPGNGTTLARDMLRKGFDKIVAIGGDVTINEVANFFEEWTGVLSGHMLSPINPDAVMGIVPSGTRNLLAKTLDLPVGVVESCQNFVAGSTKKNRCDSSRGDKS